MIKFKPFGDSAVLISFSEKILDTTYNEIVNFCNELRRNKIHGINSLIPAYNSITVSYNPSEISYDEVLKKMKSIDSQQEINEKSKIVEIPVCYHKDFALDMEELMDLTKLSSHEIIAKHTAPVYKVYMLGFMPGFCYLGGMDADLIIPRKKTPRSRIVQGSVGIGGEQTGVYPLDAPGGWQIIGRSPKKFFDKNNIEKPFLLKQGDQVRFVEISLETFKKMFHD